MLPILKKLLGEDNNTPSTINEEVEHINQEVYKKSVELSERNKTLLILRKIDEIILGTITDQREIARKVTQVLVNETDFEFCSIYKLDITKKQLNRLAIYETNYLYQILIKNSVGNSIPDIISINQTENLLVQTINNKRASSSNTLYNSIFLSDNFDLAKAIEAQSGIKSIIAYPIIVRGNSIGIIVFGNKDFEQNISAYINDLLDRVVQVVGISIDNAELYNNLAIANEKLKVLDKLKDEFVSLASHELRTPMTSVKSYLWMTLKGEAGSLNEKQRLYVERAYVSVERLIKLVNDMLNISRIESGRITIELARVNLIKLVHDVVDQVAPRASELGIRIVVFPNDKIPDVLADEDKIKEVLFNLIGNSLKFTEKNGEINISFLEKDGLIQTRVADNGAGISPQNIKKLFQKFNMLPDSYSHNKNASGSGLGLYISRSIIELHDGSMWADSNGLGKGSQFYFTLKKYNMSDSRLIGYNEIDNKTGIIHTEI